MQTVSQFGSSRRGTGQVARRSMGNRKQKPILSPKPLANGFLKHRFLPLFEPCNELPKKKDTERDFFISLSYIAAAYGLNPMDTSAYSYPYNVQLARYDLQQQLGSIMDCQVQIMKQEQQTFIVLELNYNTANVLYHIPILPLYRLIQDKTNIALSQMLLSVFAYLYHVADIPYYRCPTCDVYYQYEMLEEYLEHSWEQEREQDEDYASNRQELDATIYVGDQMENILSDPSHLNDFERRVTSFCPANPMERRFHRLSIKVWQLYRDFPGKTAFGNIEPDENYEETVRVDQYISFVYDTKGWTSAMLVQSINDYYGECGTTKEPKQTLFFDKPYNARPIGLDFEGKLFPLLYELKTYLYELP
ncbi:hypothetical protein [Pedobacter nutrimenti]|uniref:hypothetical protein n=1 Tax=Pedobacter nutrimenti TaxID=1241337 RepID=UPI00292CE118|nr:hypothetical protein [Pedobacter nutrimenti]